MKKRLPLLLFPVLALILEALPYGAVLQFARPAAAPLRELYSYFDLTPFGYANFAPLFTALGTCVLLVLLALYAGALPPQRGSQRASAPSSRSVRSCWAFRIIPLPVRSSRPPCWRNASGCAAYGDRRKKTPKTSRRGRRKPKQAPFANAAKGACFVPWREYNELCACTPLRTKHIAKSTLLWYDERRDQQTEGPLMAKEQRFERVYTQGALQITEIWIDKETGVNYLFHAGGNAGGLTPLLDRDGKPVVSPLPDR